MTSTRTLQHMLRMDLVRPDLLKKKYGAASNLKFNEKVKQMIREANRKIYHMGFGESPFPVLETAVQGLKQHASEAAYLNVQGLPELRDGICRLHKFYDDVDIDPQDIIVAPGSKVLIYLLMAVFDGEILLNSPSWTTYKPQAELSGRSPVLIDSREEDSWKVTPEGLEKAVSGLSPQRNKLLVLCNPCNPSGAHYTKEQLEELVKTCRKHNIIVLSDEIYSRTVYNDKHTSISKVLAILPNPDIKTNRRIDIDRFVKLWVYPEGGIITTGFSKWPGAGGWRIGYQIYPKELRPLLSVLTSAGSHTFSCAPAPMQYAFASALRNIDAIDDYLKHTNRVLGAVAAFGTRELRSVGVTVVEPKGGFEVFPNFEIIRPALLKRGVATGQALCDVMLEEIGVALLPGGPVHLRPVDELTTRLCYVNFDGTHALAESRRRGLGCAIDDLFVRNHCTNYYEGIVILRDWVARLKAEQATGGK